MKHKNRIVIALTCVLMLIGFLCGMRLGFYISDVGFENARHPDVERLSGAELRGMMNEDKWSPGQGDVYAEMHPDFAWLFDGSFVDYIFN